MSRVFCSKSGGIIDFGEETGGVLQNKDFRFFSLAEAQRPQRFFVYDTTLLEHQRLPLQQAMVFLSATDERGYIVAQASSLCLWGIGTDL